MNGPRPTVMDWESFYNSFRQPDFIPGYEIQNRLGGGAFGEVYKARKHSIGKAYAIKFLKLDDETQRDVIERELDQVRHFAAIDHPNLVSIEDMGTVEGVPYLVMGYAGEDTLARRMRQGNLDRRQALLYFVQACRGVLALHDRRLVHFDLKPSNIFLNGDIARVGDYGLAKLMADGRLTLSFGRGTPYYMAPEILRNRADHRADLYSLGVILYETQAGKVPFDAPSPGGLVLRQDDEPPRFPADFPAALRAVVERCLRLDPEQRYESVEELLVALGQAARPGDSIVLSPYPAREVPGSNGSARDAVPGSASGGEAADPRSAARELARGAVEVARGMWEGLRSPGGATHGTGTGPGPVPSRSERAGEGATGPAAPSRDGHAGGSGRGGPAAAQAAPTPAAAVPGTIPVPPAARGPLGALAAALVLMLEVPLALLGGALRTVGRRLPRPLGRAVGHARRWLGRGLRSILFLLALALLGAVVMFVLLMFSGVGRL